MNDGVLTIRDSAGSGMITGCFDKRNSDDQNGGAVYNTGTLNTEGGNFVTNKTEEGGAIRNDANATLNITGGVFRNNTATALSCAP